MLHILLRVHVLHDLLDCFAKMQYLYANFGSLKLVMGS